MTRKPANDKEVVGPDGGNSSSSGGIVVDNRNVALAEDVLDRGSRVTKTARCREGRWRVTEGLVMKNDKPLRVIEVAIGEEMVSCHNIRCCSCNTVALLVETNHDTKVDDVGLSVMNVEGVLNLNGSDSDLPSNPGARTITNRNGVDGSPAKGSGSRRDSVDSKIRINVLGLNT